MRAVNLLPAGSEARKSFRKEDPAVVIGSALALLLLNRASKRIVFWV